MSRSTFHGSMVALVTPMLEGGSVDFAALDALIDWHVEQGTRAVVAVGTTGESATLNTAEHIEVIARCVRRAAGRVPIIAGAGANATAEAVVLSKSACDAGADATLQVVPYYNKPPQRGLVAHFTAIAEAVDLPMLLYNVPSRTVTDLLPETTIEIARHPNVVGIKDANVRDAADASAFIQTLRGGCGDDFAILSGEDSSLFDFIKSGGDGVISVTANLLPRQMAEFCRVMLAGDFAAGGRMHETLAPVHRALFLEPNPIPVKWALTQLQRIQGGIRLPLVPLSPHLHQQLRDILPH